MVLLRPYLFFGQKVRFPHFFTSRLKCEHIYDPEKDGEGKNFEDLSSFCDMAFGKPWKCPECGAQISAYKPIKSDSESEDEAPASDGICALT